MASRVTKTVLLTGFDRGVGYSIAAQFQRLGWRVITATRDIDAAHKLHALQPHKIVAMDVNDETSVATATTTSLLGERIDALIQSGQVDDTGDLASGSRAYFATLMAVNVVTPFVVTRAFYPHLQAAATERGIAVAARIVSFDTAVEKYGCHGRALERAFRDKSVLDMVSSVTANLIVKNLPPQPRGKVLVSPGIVLTDRLLTTNGELSAAGVERLVDTLLAVFQEPAL